MEGLSRKRLVATSLNSPYPELGFRKMLSQQGITPCILPRRCRKKPVHDHIENLFSRLKDWRRLATRYDGCAHVFRSGILLAAIGLFW